MVGKILTSALCLLLAVFFIMAVFNYGRNERYSFMAHVQFITTEFSKTPSFEEFIIYWTEESFVPSYNGIDLTAGPGGGTNGGGFSGGSRYEEEDGRVYPEKIGSLTDEGAFLEPLWDFFGAVKGFFVRAYFSILWVCNFVVQIFQNIYAFMPWNGNVPIEEVTA